MPSNDRPRRPWLTIGLALLAAITFLMVSDRSDGVIQPMRGYGVSDSTSVQPSKGMESGAQGTPAATRVVAPDYYPYPYPGTNVSITDTREFLKMSYQATMRTRSVQELTRRAETTIRGFSGRVDQISSSEKYGYVSFVVPASKFSAFRDEIESFVAPRFLKVNISSQNLLPQKVSIEEQQKGVEKNLVDLQAQRKATVAAHDSKVKSLQAEINANASAQAVLRAEVTSDPARQAAIAAQLSQLAVDLVQLKSRLTNENSNYANNIASIDAQLTYANEVLAAVKTQDQNLIDNVATVDGTISLEWISLWEIAQLYLPGYWIPSILAVAAVLAYLWERRRHPRVARA